MPKVFAEFGESWCDLHPNWTMKLWTEENLPTLTNLKEFLAADTLPGKSNILRYEVLQQFGGVYIDTDFACLQSIECLLVDVGAFAGELRGGLICNAIIGCTQRHAFINDLVRYLPGNDLALGNHAPILRTGLHFMHMVIKSFHADDVKVFSPQVFYPIPPGQSLAITSRFSFGPETFAVHLWCDA